MNSDKTLIRRGSCNPYHVHSHGTVYHIAVLLYTVSMLYLHKFDPKYIISLKQAIRYTFLTLPPSPPPQCHTVCSSPRSPPRSSRSVFARLAKRLAFSCWSFRAEIAIGDKSRQDVESIDYLAIIISKWSLKAVTGRRPPSVLTSAKVFGRRVFVQLLSSPRVYSTKTRIEKFLLTVMIRLTSISE